MRPAHPLPSDFVAGLRLIRAGKDFEAHEAIEQVWKASTGRARLGCQAVLQLAVSRHQLARRNAWGALSNLAKVRAKLPRLGPDFWGVRLAAWLESLEEFYAGLGLSGPPRRGLPVPELPPRCSWPGPAFEEWLLAELEGP